ncbi:unnamed protein product [Closterium sp. NIES-54]
MKSTRQRPAGLLQPLEPPERPWQQVTMDFVTGMPAGPSSNDAVLVVVDRLTKMAHFAPCHTTITTKETTRLFFSMVVRLHGIPSAIINDRDPKFTSKFWKETWAQYGTKLQFSSAYRPQMDGQTERTNQTMEQLIRKNCPDPARWEDSLAMLDLLRKFVPATTDIARQQAAPTARPVAEPTLDPSKILAHRVHLDAAGRHVEFLIRWTDCTTELRHLAEPRRCCYCRYCCYYCSTAITATAAPLPTASTAAMASPTVLTFNSEGRVVDFDVWVDDLQFFLQCDSRDGVSLFYHTSGVSTAPPITADSTVRSQWTTRDVVARLAVRSHLPPAERAHLGQYKTAQSLYDAVVPRYSSPATAALSRLMLPYLSLTLPPLPQSLT